MSTETRDVLLYGKLQDGLWIDLVSKALAISGAQNYQELCIAAKNEERRLAELKKRRQYAKDESFQYQTNQTSHSQQTPMITRRNLLSVNRLDVTYVIAHIILAMTAKLIKLRVEVKLEWCKLEQNLTSKATTFLRLLKSCFHLLPPHKTLRLWY